MIDDNINALVIAEHDNQTISIDTLKTISAAKTLVKLNASTPTSISVLVIGNDCQSVAGSASGIEGVTNVIVADAQCYQISLTENLSKLIVKYIQSGVEDEAPVTHVFTSATTFGKDLMPRVAALLGVGQLSDVIAIEAPDVVVRPIYAGNALARVKSNDPIKVMTIRSSAYDAAEMNSDNQCKITEFNEEISASDTEFVSQQKVKTLRPELPAARVVIAGGRGLGSKENFALVEQLADKLDGAIGASRAAVDAGFVANDLQVGQTGKIVAPELYIAIGISGAIQHLAGMKDSKVIVAINSDPEAPIFEIADYGLVGDLFELMPELIDSV
ncbi:FAD-binding protein [Vibrio lamellibrachiae]|uniref:electron transfer flavoprotein subunit alpha/FixB family protein n=1 Tax=Vibrio lamellibrachiae TaxID=2910253 RepID=UPI003D0E4254